MDVATWPMWAKALAGWGPLGIWAGIMTYAYLAARKTTDKAQAAQATRFAGVVAAMAKDAQEREAKLHQEHRREVVTLSMAFAEATTAAGTRHAAQEDELIDRLLAASEKHGETTKGLAERLAALAESMKRRERDNDDGPST